MTSDSTETSVNFFVRWVLYTLVGYVVGFAAGFLLAHFLLGNVMVGMAVGASVGYMQWLLLRHYVPSSSFWIVDNLAGMTVALTMYSVVNMVYGYPFDLGVPGGALGWGIAFVLAGAFAGFFQYRILHRALSQSLVWVPASAIAWGLSVVGLSIPPDMTNPMPLWLFFPRNLLLAPTVAGLILGVVTGGAILWILKRSEQSDDDVAASS